LNELSARPAVTFPAVDEALMSCCRCVSKDASWAVQGPVYVVHRVNETCGRSGDSGQDMSGRWSCILVGLSRPHNDDKWCFINLSVIQPGLVLYDRNTASNLAQ